MADDNTNNPPPSPLLASRGQLIYNLSRAVDRGRRSNPRLANQYYSMQNRVGTGFALVPERVPVVTPRSRGERRVNPAAFPHVARTDLTPEEARVEQRRRVGLERKVNSLQPSDILWRIRRAQVGSFAAFQAEWARFRLEHELADRGYGEVDADDDAVTREIEEEIRRDDQGDGDVDSDQDSVMGDHDQDFGFAGLGISFGTQGSNASQENRQVTRDDADHHDNSGSDTPAPPTQSDEDTKESLDREG